MHFKSLINANNSINWYSFSRRIWCRHTKNMLMMLWFVSFVPIKPYLFHFHFLYQNHYYILRRYWVMHYWDLFFGRKIYTIAHYQIILVIIAMKKCEFVVVKTCRSLRKLICTSEKWWGKKRQQKNLFQK